MLRIPVVRYAGVYVGVPPNYFGKLPLISIIAIVLQSFTLCRTYKFLLCRGLSEEC